MPPELIPVSHTQSVVNETCELKAMHRYFYNILFSSEKAYIYVYTSHAIWFDLDHEKEIFLIKDFINLELLTFLKHDRALT